MAPSPSTAAGFVLATQGPPRWLAALRRLGLAALLALALTPLVIDPLARDDTFMAPKWAWIAIFTALGLAAVAARALAGGAAMFSLRAPWLAALLLCLWHWASIGWAVSASLAFERAARVSWLTLALWLGLQLLAGRRALPRLGWLVVALGSATALWVLTEDFMQAFFRELVWVRPNLPDWRGFLSAGLGNTNHLGDLMALALLPALVFFGEARRRLALGLAGAAAIVLAAALIVVFSAGSNLGLVVGAALLAGLVLARIGGRWFLLRWRRWAVLALAWGGLILFFNTDHPLNPHRPAILSEGFSSGRWQEGGPTRLAIYAQTLEMIRQHPLAGVGAGNFTYVFPEMDSALLWNRPDLMRYQGLWTNAAHNEPLQAWAELGILGLFLLATLLVAGFHTLLKDLERAGRFSFMTRATLAAMLAAWVVHSQINFAFQTPVGMLTLYGILLGALIEREARRRERRLPPLRFETEHLALRVEWRTMRRPTAGGLAFLLSPRLAIVLGAMLLAVAVAWAPLRLAPVRAQREYRRAVMAPDPAAAEHHYRRGLAIHPAAHDLRSNYSQWLLEQGRPADSLEQVAIVRERLNDYQSLLRMAQALEMLGRTEEAAAVERQLHDRLWLYRQ